MKISYNKLQTYLIDKLPSPEALADAFTFHAFEIESVEKEGDDTILDIKVLPDRACYAKSYEGIAREVSTILGLKKVDGLVKFDTTPRKITVNVVQINEVLGSDISSGEMADILTRMDIVVEEGGNGEMTLSIPSDRLDLASWRDIPEEVGRIHGYDKIGAILPKNTTFEPQIEKTFYYAEKVKNILVEQGFSEVYTYSLVPKGDYEIEKPLASDKNHLRTNLSDGISKSLELNAKNAELLGLDAIKIFEIGKVFTKEGEFTHLAIGAVQVKKIKGVKSDGILVTSLEALEKELGATISNRKITTTGTQSVWELNFDALIKDLPTPSSYSDLNFHPATKNTYKKFSVYPFIVRDIAVFGPESVAAETVWGSIQKGIDAANAGSLLERYSLFDAFKKEGKISYAFRMVFQSIEKTLTDDEANAIMEKIYAEMKTNSWEVR
ncbi:MAG: hypothetical protein KBC33_02520 [Candidatus Pacebacteria bacterium]|nr:hypothetical protein [Candidatus Paceibacterota bacterium]